MSPDCLEKNKKKISTYNSTISKPKPKARKTADGLKIRCTKHLPSGKKVYYLSSLIAKLNKSKISKKEEAILIAKL